MPVTRHPPHGSVRALLTHTVLTLDVLPEIRVIEREANVGKRVLDLNFRQEFAELLQKLVPRPAASLTPPSKLPQPHALHFVSKSFQALLVARNRVVLEVSANH